MVIAITFILTVLIICGSILFGIYMVFCADAGIKMFEDPRYEERIKNLEKRLKEMENIR